MVLGGYRRDEFLDAVGRCCPVHDANECFSRIALAPMCGVYLVAEFDAARGDVREGRGIRRGVETDAAHHLGIFLEENHTHAPRRVCGIGDKLVAAHFCVAGRLHPFVGESRVSVALGVLAPTCQAEIEEADIHEPQFEALRLDCVHGVHDRGKMGEIAYLWLRRRWKP